MRVKPAILAVTQDIAEMARTLGVHLIAANRRFFMGLSSSRRIRDGR
jgi:hypothetical protein